MVLLGRIELPTSSLPMTRSTTELQQRSYKDSAKVTIKLSKCHVILPYFFIDICKDITVLPAKDMH